VVRWARAGCGAALALGAALSGCECLALPQEYALALTMWNRSQFAVERLYLHRAPEPSDPTSLLDERPLAPEAHLLVAFDSGHYVTAVHGRANGVGRVAVTTESAVTLDGPGYTLVIFDYSFRLLAPDSPDNPFGAAQFDGGPSFEDAAIDAASAD
jgi:hypothetical protein